MECVPLLATCRTASDFSAHLPLPTFPCRLAREVEEGRLKQKQVHGGMKKAKGPDAGRGLTAQAAGAKEE